MKSSFKALSVFAALIASASVYASQTGSKSSVESIYIGTSGSSPYITLKKPDSMPGCYANRSGYLAGSDIDKAFAVVLAAQKSGSEIQVSYTVNEGRTGWSQCTINALTAY